MISFDVTKKDRQFAGIVSIMITSYQEALMARGSVHNVIENSGSFELFLSHQ